MIDPSGSWLIQCLGLFLETFVQEDLAIFTGGILVVNHSMPLIFVFFSLIAGLLSGDIAIYGLGRAAREIPWIYKRIVNTNVEKAKNKLKNKLVSTIVFVRLIPGILFPTYIACGLIGVSFSQFLLTTFAAGTAYTAIVLTIIVKLGETFIPSIGYWGWVIVFVAGLLFISFKMLRQRKIVTVGNASALVDLTPEIPSDEKSFMGMPSLRSLGRKVAISERIPPFLFYSPVGIHWLLLGIRYRSILLPTVTNPLIEAGGLWGESKSRLLDQVTVENKKWIAPYTTVGVEPDTELEDIMKQARKAMTEADLAYPVVVKPDIGWQGYGVRIVNDDNEFLNYLTGYPKKAKLIIQKLIPWDAEAGVFYSRLPGEEHGKIISLTFRYFPHVIGNGVSTVDELIKVDLRTKFKSKFYLGRDSLHSGLTEEDRSYVPAEGELFRLAFIGSIRVGGLYRNGSNFITPALHDRFEAIGRSIPEFYFGRFDIKFRSLDDLKNGEEFMIFEINGAGAEAIHVWDADTPLMQMYRELFRYQTMMFRIGAYNRKRGFKPMPVKEFYSFTRDYNNLISSYPSSE